MKRRSGLLLFWLSWLLWGVVFVVPFVLDGNIETIAVLTTSLLVAAEVCFALSLLLLGRPFLDAIKARVRSLWHQIKSNRLSEHE